MHAKKWVAGAVVLGGCWSLAAGQLPKIRDIPLPLPNRSTPQKAVDDAVNGNNGGGGGGRLTAQDELVLRAVRPKVKEELEGRLNRLPSISAWESMEEYDGPIATLMAILSPDDVERVKQDYLREAQGRLANRGTPKLSAEAAMGRFAQDIAWQLKSVSARSPHRLTLVIGQVIAKDEADQKLVDEVLAQLVEDESLTNDYAIISVPRDQADKVIDQVSGSAEQWTMPDGANSNQVQTKVYHPDSIYVIDGTLRQWTEAQGQEFHSEFAARLFHPRTQTMIGGREIRQDDVYYFHPTRHWISEADEVELTRTAPPPSDLSPVFKAAAPVARRLLENRLMGLSNEQREARDTAVLVDAGSRELAKSEYHGRVSRMPALVAWQDINRQGSNANSLLSMLSPGGVDEARQRYARRSRNAFLVQATPKVTTDEVVQQFVAATAQRMEAEHVKLGRRPVLVLGEVKADDARTQRMLYDVYAGLAGNEVLQKTCVVIGLSPDKAQALIDELSGGAERWTRPDGANVSEVSLQSFDAADTYVVQGSFEQGLAGDGKTFRSSMTTTLLPCRDMNKVAAAAAAGTEQMSFSSETVYHYHPIHRWIPASRENELASSYDAGRDDGPLPPQLASAMGMQSAEPVASSATEAPAAPANGERRDVRPAAPAPQEESRQPKRGPKFRLPF